MAEGKRSYIGSYVNGIGFVLDQLETAALIASDKRNRDVLFPYLSGEDVNSSPSHEASRWVINFFDWPIERAQKYEACFDIVDERVRPEREKVNRKAHRERWWQYGDKRPALYSAIAEMERVIVITLVSKVIQPAFVPTGQVFAHKVGVFAYDDDFHFGVLTSAFHWWWAVSKSSTLGAALNYSPSDVFETFPQPSYSDAVEAAGKALDAHRSALMIRNDEGLTKTYNRVHNPDDDSPGIPDLRELHVALDLAVRDAYGCSNLDLDHGFHDTPQGRRFTLGPTARTEVLDRLLELNHQRYAEEIAAGLHDKRKPGGRRKKTSPDARTLL